MSTRCKVGDLVVATRPFHREHGVGFVTRISGRAPSVISALMGEQVWVFETPYRAPCGCELPGAPDGCLRPLRDNPGQDETITRVGKPAPEGVPA